MKGLLRKYIASIILVVGSFSVLVGFILYSHEAKKNQLEYFDILTQQIEYTLDKNDSQVEEATKDFIADYVKIAKEIAYILEKEEGVKSKNEEIKHLRTIMEIDEIHLVDKNGIVVLSSSEDKIGFNFNQEEEEKAFLNVIISKEHDAQYIKAKENLFEQKEMIYIGVKPYNSTEGMIQIGVDPKRFWEENAQLSITRIFDDIPTEEDLAAFIIDKESGELLGITRNNDSTITIEDNEHLVEELEKCSNGKVLEINEKKRFVYVVTYQGKLIGSYVDLERVSKLGVKNLLIAAVVVFFIILCIVVLLELLVERFIIRDIDYLATGIDKVLDGDLEIQFESKYETEISKIASGLNKWVHSYKARSARLTALAELADKNFATFEYVEEINHMFYSKNLSEVLGLSDSEWKELIKNPKMLYLYIEYLKPIKDYKNTYKTKLGRYLRIEKYRDNGEFCGLIRDVTDEIKEKHKILNALQIAEKNANTDSLTKLKNIRYAKKEIQAFLDKEDRSGMLFIFDLDNFKVVNDEMGHPEGDKLLIQFANCLKDNFKENSLIARLGGDEFIVFLKGDIKPEEAEEAIQRVIEDARSRLSQYYVKYRVSVSVGMTYVKKEIDKFEQLYEYADAALYVAKRHGKDGYYLNKDYVTCTKNECEHCLEDCDRRKTLRLK